MTPPQPPRHLRTRRRYYLDLFGSGSASLGLRFEGAGTFAGIRGASLLKGRQHDEMNTPVMAHGRPNRPARSGSGNRELRPLPARHMQKYNS
jgi:hypothetical protein